MNKLKVMVIAATAAVTWLSARADAYQSDLSGSTGSNPVSVRPSDGIALNSGSLSTPTPGGPLEARSKTWLASNAIGIDPWYVPGFMFILK